MDVPGVVQHPLPFTPPLIFVPFRPPPLRRRAPHGPSLCWTYLYMPSSTTVAGRCHKFLRMSREKGGIHWSSNTWRHACCSPSSNKFLVTRKTQNLTTPDSTATVAGDTVVYLHLGQEISSFECPTRAKSLVSLLLMFFTNGLLECNMSFTSKGRDGLMRVSLRTEGVPTTMGDYWRGGFLP